MLLAREAGLGWLLTGETTREAQGASEADGDKRGVLVHLPSQAPTRDRIQTFHHAAQGPRARANRVKYLPFFCEKCHSVGAELRVPWASRLIPRGDARKPLTTKNPFGITDNVAILGHRSGRLACPLPVALRSPASGRGDPISTRSYFGGTSTETHNPAHDLDRLGRRSVCARRTSVRGAGGTRGGQPAIWGLTVSVTLVLADDQPIILYGLEHLFAREQDFHVLVSCATGEETLKAVRRHRPRSWCWACTSSQKTA